MTATSTSIDAAAPKPSTNTVPQKQELLMLLLPLLVALLYFSCFTATDAVNKLLHPLLLLIQLYTPMLLFKKIYFNFNTQDKTQFHL